VDYDQVALAKPFRQRRAESTAAHLLRHRVRPISRLRPMDVAAALPKGRSERGDTGTARSLLLPELAARPGNISAGLCRRGALAAVGLIVTHGGVDQGLVQLSSENRIRQRDLADLFILQIANLYGRHNLLLFANFDCRISISTRKSQIDIRKSSISFS